VKERKLEVMGTATSQPLEGTRHNPEGTRQEPRRYTPGRFVSQDELEEASMSLAALKIVHKYLVYSAVLYQEFAPFTNLRLFLVRVEAKSS
jgi:hypothetical protein